MKTILRPLLSLGLAFAMLSLVGCIGSGQTETQKHADANSAAGKLGKAAHAVAAKSGQAADAIGRDLGKAARQAHAGWQEASQQDKQKKRQ